MQLGLIDLELPSALIQGIYEAASEGILVVNDKRVIVFHNRRFVDIWQIQDDLLRGQVLSTAIGLDDTRILKAIFDCVKDAVDMRARVDGLYANRDLDDTCETDLRDGRTLWCHTTGLTGHDGTYIGRMWFFRDVTDHKRIERSLRLAQFTIDWAQDAIFRMNKNGQIVYVNIAACQHLGYPEDELLRLSVPDINPGSSPEAWHAHWQDMTEAGWRRFETYHKRKDGTIVPVEVVANLITINEERIFFSFVRNISDRKKAEAEIRSLAFSDPLTKLPNRRLLLDRLNVALSASARNHQYGAVLFVDVDKFKAVNDALGHDYGDMLLVQVAERIKSSVRDVDTVARFAGDEFVVLLEEVGVALEDSKSNVTIVVERIRAALASPYQLLENTYTISVSIGVSLFYDHEMSVDELIKHADMAMYRVKNSGGDAALFFDPLLL
ncbi:MAG: diguanylate cyclase domain-containing protein [Acidiferrobacter sp.]